MSALNPDPAQQRVLVEQVARHVAASTGLTTIVTVGISADDIPVVTRQGFSPLHLDASYERLLVTAADLVRRYPRGIPASSCALILPDRDVAYLHHRDTGTGLAQVLPVGRNPIDLPTTRTEVSRGLATLMRALVDTQATRPSAAGAFLTDPTARISLLPPPTQPPTPPPGGPEHRRPHR